jgi:hypothetical protein
VPRRPRGQELLAIVQQGDARRCVSATLSNERSSRSHAVLTIAIRPLAASTSSDTHYGISVARGSKRDAEDVRAPLFAQYLGRY